LAQHDDAVLRDDDTGCAALTPAHAYDGWANVIHEGGYLRHASHYTTVPELLKPSRRMAVANEPAGRRIRDDDGIVDAVSERDLPADELAHVAQVAERLGDRWSLVIVAALLSGPLRYGELQERVRGIAPNILTARLRKLENDGIIASSPYSERPPRFEYRLTADGEALADALRLLIDWSLSTQGGEPLDAPTHLVCGAPLQVRWWCPVCEEATTPAEDESVQA
jgi:DNA-binding HxlR family transcriptional regulator